MVTEMRFDASKWFRILSGPIFQPLETLCRICSISFPLKRYDFVIFLPDPLQNSSGNVCRERDRREASEQKLTDAPRRESALSQSGWKWGWYATRIFVIFWTFLLAAGDGGTAFFFEPPPKPPEPPLISMLTELFGFTFIKNSKPFWKTNFHCCIHCWALS